MLRLRLTIVLGVLGLGLWAGPAVGAESTERPRLGLVLSGGGARGLAHVGVLKVLEELRVPVDVVTGTSMGGIVGGLYACGYSADELEDILLAIDWRDLLNDRPGRRMVPFRRKVDDLKFLTDLEIGFNRGRFQLPSGLVTGQKLNFLLEALTIHTVDVGGFDRLPIPFLTVATDLETGDEVVLRSGDLGNAMRATMAVPGVFAPAEIEGRVLVDGGLVNNLPVDLARGLGAEVVVAVDVGEPLRSRDELRSLNRVAGQVLSLMVRGNVEPQERLADLVIRPQVQSIGSAEFHKVDRLIPLGEEAALKHAEWLSTYAVDAAAYDRYRERLERPQIVDRTVAGIEVALGATADPEFVLRKIRTRPGDPLDARALARDLERLYATGDYEMVSLDLHRVEDGYLVTIDAREKGWGPNTMRFGLNLSADLEGGSAFNVLANYTITRLNRLRGEAKLEVQVGQQSRIFGELYQPLDLGGRFFFAPSLELVTFRAESLSSAAGPAADFDVQQVQGGLDVGLSLDRWGELRIGMVGGRGSADPRRAPAEVAGFDFDWAGLGVRAVFDQIDDPNFPRRGMLVSGELLAARQSLGSDDDFDRLQFDAVAATSRGRHTLLGIFDWGSALGSELPFWAAFELGGLFRLSGHPPRTFSGRYLALAVAGYYYQVADFGRSFAGAAYAGLSLEAGNVWRESSQVGVDDVMVSGALYAGLDTLIGPLYMGYGKAEGGADTWYLFVGRSF
jgi:NTE family protein